jgi:hypothetical protein
MSFSFEILSEGSLVFVWKSSFSFLLDWIGVRFACAIYDPFTDAEFLFLTCGSMAGENCNASGAAILMAATVHRGLMHPHHGLIHAAL